MQRAALLWLTLALLPACLPIGIGGGAKLGAACEDDNDCHQGLVCVEEVGGLRACRSSKPDGLGQAPTPDAPTPDDGQPTPHDNGLGDSPVCGNSICQPGEDPSSCPQDCQGIDPCGGVPSTGRCIDGATIEQCVFPTGSASPRVETYACRSGEACVEQGGSAWCELTTQCYDGQSRCNTPQVVAWCEGGSWQSETCDTGCISTALGSGCRTSRPTRTLSGTVQYEARSPNNNLTDWGSTERIPGGGLIAITGSQDEVFDAAFVEQDGSFSVEAPSDPQAQEWLYFAAVLLDQSGGLFFTVADAGYQPSSQARSVEANPPEPYVWTWAWDLVGLNAQQPFVITQENGSGAVRYFQYGAYILSKTLELAPEVSPRSLVVWLGPQTNWDCGACFAPFPIEALDTSFQSQLWAPGGSDEGYWSDAVTAHELGHYIMASYSFDLAEGGAHTIGVPTHPNQAWSEGWATFFSAMIRESPYYYDKQQGFFFWFDIDQRRYPDLAWTRHDANDGLFGLTDENEVSAMMWHLHERVGPQAIFDALTSPRMTTSPFARGYYQRTWDPSDPSRYDTLPYSLPILADFFDAAMCGNHATAADLDAVAQPQRHYPYPSNRPMCQRGKLPVQATLRALQKPRVGDVLDLVFEAWRAPGLALPLTATLKAPAGVTLLGPDTLDWPLGQPSLSWPVRVRIDADPAGPLEARLDGEVPGVSFHGAAQHRLTLPEPALPAPPARLSQPLPLRFGPRGPALRARPVRMP
jgi:hypothetical protein